MEKKSFINVSGPDLSGKEKEYVNKCLSSGWVSSKGQFIKDFEEFFAKYIGTRFAVSTSNGTTALHLALVALGIGKGDEVIIPDLTFVACANTVIYTGAKPIFVDVERAIWNIDPKKIEEKISRKTKAIMVVHLYGHPANMNIILPIAKKYRLFIIEDVAEAHGAEIKMQEWKKAGSVGDVGCFSFYANKILTTGEGGMILTNNKHLAEKMRILRDHGQDPKRRYYHKVIGFNYRMTNLQAALGVAQLERIKEFVAKKRWIGNVYRRLLESIPGITLSPEKSWAKSVYWMYSILVDKPYPKTRDQLMSIFQKEQIETRPFFYPLHLLPPYKINGEFINSNYLSKHGINLPSGVRLTVENIRRVAGVIKRYIA